MATLKERWKQASEEADLAYLAKAEKRALKKSKGSIVTMEVLAKELNAYLNRGWKLEQFYSKGFTGLRMALISHTRSELEAQL